MASVAYSCTAGHRFTAPSGVPICQCPYCIDGKPCSAPVVPTSGWTRRG